MGYAWHSCRCIFLGRGITMEKTNEELIEELQYEINELQDKVERLEDAMDSVIGILRQRGIY